MPSSIAKIIPLTAGEKILGVTKKEPRICDKHGEYLSFIRESGYSSKCPGCIEEEDRIEQENARKRFIEASLARAKIPPRFVNKSFDEFAAKTPSATKILNSCRQYAENFKDHKQSGSGLILIGKTGTGKTHLACAIASYAVSTHKATALYTTVSRAMRAITRTWLKNSEKSEGEVYKTITSPDLLILDEIGIQYGNETERNALFEIVNRRYERLLPTILIGNVKKEKLKECIDERVLDRMREGGKLYVFDWDSARKEF